MIPPKMYSLESYEPDILRPDEINQNRVFNKPPFSDKNLPRLNYLPGNTVLPTLNIRPIINNNQHIRPQIIKSNNNVINPQVVKSSKAVNNILQIKYQTNPYTLTVPTSISMKNPFSNKTFINSNHSNKSNKILNSYNFTNPFLDKKTNNIQYIQPISNKNVNIYYQKNVIPQFNNKIVFQNNIRSKSNQNFHNFNAFQSKQTSAISSNSNLMPIYRRIVYRKKN